LEVSGQLHVPAALTPGKEPAVRTGYEAGWAPQPVWVVQPVGSRYTNYAIPSPFRGKKPLEKVGIMRIMSKWILKKQDMRVWTGVIRPSIGIDGGIL
jgi:hypothetical protein